MTEREALEKACDLIASAYAALLLLHGNEPETIGPPLSALTREELLREVIHCTGFAQTLAAKYVSGGSDAVRAQMNAYQAELERRRAAKESRRG